MESIEQLLKDYPIYIVMVIVLIVWGGIFMYLLSMDKKIKKIENELKKDSDE